MDRWGFHEAEMSDDSKNRRFLLPHMKRLQVSPLDTDVECGDEA